MFIGHTDDSGLGQVSRLSLTSSPNGPLQLNPVSGGFILPPTYRQKEWTVTQRFGGSSSTTPVHDFLSGNSVIDLCVDDMINNGAAFGQANVYAPSYTQTPYQHSGKHVAKAGAGGVLPANSPRLMFIALSDTGNVDVFELQTGTRVATLAVPGVRVVANYWRQ